MTQNDYWNTGVVTGITGTSHNSYLLGTIRNARVLKGRNGMSATLDSGQSVPMSDETRGHSIKQRRLRHGIGSVSEFERLTGVTRKAITKAEAGDPSTTENTYARLEAWLDKYEDEIGSEQDAANAEAEAVAPAPPAAEMIELEIQGNFGVRFYTRATAANLEVARQQLEILVERQMRAHERDQRD